MKHAVRRFKSSALALKELEPFIRNGEHLQTGKPLARFGGLRSREILANWLLCAVLTDTSGDEHYFTTDPLNGDGIIVNSRTDESWPMEHVMVPELPATPVQSIDQRILGAVRQKNGKGGQSYAQGKTLVVFVNAKGEPWYPNRVVRSLPKPMHFGAVWTAGLQSAVNGEYIYGVSLLALSAVDAPTWLVTIAADFGSWVVTRIQ